MSTRTDWGLFRRDGSRLEPVAIGDEWHKWKCPKREWTYPDPEPHPYTGEMISAEPYQPQCPFKYDGPKREKCSRCDMEFIYP